MNMPGNFKKEDIRILKTHRALINSMSKLLELHNFTRITTNDLCEEAQISRATFYFHFADKYDLLKYWLENRKPMLINKKDTKEEVEKRVNHFVSDNLKSIKHLIDNANSETSELLYNFTFSLLDLQMEETDSKEMYQERLLFTQFCSGGMMNYLWHYVNGNFSEDFQIMNPYYCGLLDALIECCPK